MKKHLNAKGKGEYKYDLSNDILLFKIKNRDYRKSIEFDNIIIDIDAEGFIIGIRIFDASKIFKKPKSALKDVMAFKFDASIENKVISIDLSFSIKFRNKQIEQGQNLVREAIDSAINDSEVSCSV